MSDGFSPWVVTERIAMHAEHAARAGAFMRPSVIPYQETKYNGGVAKPTGPNAEARRAAAAWELAVPREFRQSLQERILLRREVVGHAD